MDRTSTAIAIGSLVTIAIIAGTLAPADRDQRADAGTVIEKVIGDRDGGAPIVVAQGRCQNGRCR